MTSSKMALSARWVTIIIAIITLLVSGSVSWGVTSTLSSQSEKAASRHIEDESVHANVELIEFRLTKIDESLVRIESLLGNP